MGLREAKPSGVLPFRVGMDEYRSFIDETARNGVHSVTVIGSSRAREAVLPLSMRRAITAEFGCAPTTANHALPGAHAMEAELAVRRMLESPQPPRLVLYGLGPRQLLAKPRPWVNASYLWSPSEWLAARREHGPEVDPYVGRVLRTWLPSADELAESTSLLDRSAVDTLVDDIGDPGLVVTLLKTYLTELPVRVERILVAGEESSEVSGVEEAAHVLKSTSAIVGAAALSDLAAELEQGARNGSAPSKAQREQLRILAASTETEIASIAAGLEGTA